MSWFHIFLSSFFIARARVNVELFLRPYTHCLTQTLSDIMPMEIHYNHPPECMERDSQSLLSFRSTNPSPSIYPFISLLWLKPPIPNGGDPSGPSACVSLPLTGSPSLSAPDLPTSPRGSQQTPRQREEGAQGDGERREDIGRERKEGRMEGVEVRGQWGGREGEK